MYITAVSLNDSSTIPADYLRIISIAIAAYDYVITLPAEFRFYQAQRGILDLTQGCILFILIRYMSLLSIVASNAVFFTPLSEETCHHIYLLAIPFRLVATMVSQIILGWRCYAISRRARWVKYTLVISWLALSTGEGFVNFWARIPEEVQGHCLSGNGPRTRVVWLHYLFATFFDLLTLIISSTYLWRYTPNTYFMMTLIKRMTFEGIGYFLLLTVGNILNLIIFKQASLSIQSAGVTLGVAITWICSQRILISLRETSEAHSSVPTVPSRSAGITDNFDTGIRDGLILAPERGRYREHDQNEDDPDEVRSSRTSRRDAKDWLSTQSTDTSPLELQPSLPHFAPPRSPHYTPAPTTPHSGGSDAIGQLQGDALATSANEYTTMRIDSPPPSKYDKLKSKVTRSRSRQAGGYGFASTNSGEREMSSFGSTHGLPTRAASGAGSHMGEDSADMDMQVHVERTVAIKVDPLRGQALGGPDAAGDLAAINAYLHGGRSYYGGGDDQGREDYSQPATVTFPLGLTRLSEGGEDVYPEGRIVVSRAAV